MAIFTDCTDACPKCLSKDLRRHDLDTSGQWGEHEFYDRYTCNACGYTFTDVYRYHHSHDDATE